MTNESVEAILERARRRAIEMKLPYAGALLPAEAHALARQVPGARLVDVRTKPEWEYVGRIPGSVRLEWNIWPGGRNAKFMDELEAQVEKSDAPVMFLCRSGARSHAAAIEATRAGYPNCYNVLEGFEGDKDANGHRNTVGGWRVAGLPWEQG
ncbi:MAG: rhodanese-like domain-containing protein [Betaproteobacteria bacterium]|nr:rhodanese-like domain-containing protein [Betaproteobacteria bacterium]